MPSASASGSSRFDKALGQRLNGFTVFSRALDDLSSISVILRT